ncbi:MAG: acyltransferase family protein [Acidobacteria bacterium]|nr:acyltransferase family protein [Acidobacteriota bacterium]
MPQTAEIEITTSAPSNNTLTNTAPPRDLYIDRLRTVMTVFVILHHTAITYGASGSWFYNELHVSGDPQSILLTLFCATNQAYFMGFFFLLAGYFTPGSLERKGFGQFIGDRFTRLGIPLLAFIFILGPLTVAMVAAHDGKPFWKAFPYLWNHAIIINGPLWFAQALLIFSLAYCAWRAAFGSPLSSNSRLSRAIPLYSRWLLSAILVGAGSLAIRQFVPTGVNIIGLQLGYFAPYIFLFAIGIAAWRYDWLRQLEWKHARPWIITLIAAWPAMPVAIAIAMRIFPPGKANFGGGHTWPAIVYAFWDPFVSWGLIAAWLIIARATMNKPSALWSWLNRRAYAVYIIHPPVLVGVSLLLHSFAAPAILKFVITGTLSCIATWLIADPLVRIPVIRRIV